MTSKKRQSENSKKTADFPIMFYHSIPAEKAEKNVIDPDSRQKQILLWGGVALVMAFLIFFWGWNLKTRLYQFSPEFKTDLSFLKTEKTNQWPANNESASSALSPAQLQELKKKIEKRK